MNNVILTGRLVKDPELKYTQTNKPVCKFNLAVNDYDEKVNFIPIVVWGKIGENCDRYLSKGSQVCVKGRIVTGSYEGKNGRVYTTDVVAENVEFLGKSDEKAEPKVSGKAEEVIAKIQEEFDGVPFSVAEDDIPF